MLQAKPHKSEWRNINYPDEQDDAARSLIISSEAMEYEVKKIVVHYTNGLKRSYREANA